MDQNEPEVAGDEVEAPPRQPIVATWAGTITLRGNAEAPTVTVLEELISSSLEGAIPGDAVEVGVSLTRTDR